jgi:hypothetical protein
MDEWILEENTHRYFTNVGKEWFYINDKDKVVWTDGLYQDDIVCSHINFNGDVEGFFHSKEKLIHQDLTLEMAEEFKYEHFDIRHRF